MRILLASGERLSGVLVKELLAAGHQIVGVMSPIPKRVMSQQFRGLRYWRKNLRGWDIRDVCVAARIPIRVTENLSEGSIHSMIKQSRPDLLLVFSWPRLIKNETLRLFPRGGMNIHPSLLPQFRGGDPLFFVLDSGSESMGLTFHRITSELDAGPIYLQVPLPQKPTDCYDDLYFRTIQSAAHFLPAALEAQDRNPSGTEQEGEAIYCPKFTTQLTYLNPSAPAVETSRRARACYPHHPMLFQVGRRKFRFKRCLETGVRSQLPNGSILRVGWSSLDVVLDGHVCRLTKVRRSGWAPLWMPLLLLRLRKGKMIAEPTS